MLDNHPTESLYRPPIAQCGMSACCCTSVQLLAWAMDDCIMVIQTKQTTLTLLTSYFFTALHGMQTRSSDENSVCLSVRLSVRHTRGL